MKVAFLTSTQETPIAGVSLLIVEARVLIGSDGSLYLRSL